MLKKILLILALIAVAVFIGFGIYYIFKKTPAGQKYFPTPAKVSEPGALPGSGERPVGEGGVPSTIPGTLPTAGALPTASKPGIYKPETVTQATSNYVTNPSLNNTGAMRYYNVADGKFYRLGADGNIKELADQVFYNVSGVTWAKNQDKAILEYPDGSKVVYDFKAKKQLASLPKYWQDFSFSPEGDQIAAKSIGLAPENRWLVVTGDDGTGTKVVEALGTNADLVQINWSPNRQVVAFSKTGEALGFDRAEILLVGLNHENFKSLTIEGRGFLPSWSPSGNKLLYSVYSNRTDLKPELWITSASGDAVDTDRRMLKINTWADKCAFGDDNTIFCAIPQNLPTGAGMSRAIADQVADDLYKIDLTTGLKSQIPTGDSSYTIKNINYDPAANKVYFTDINKSGIFEAGL